MYVHVDSAMEVWSVEGKIHKTVRLPSLYKIIHNEGILFRKWRNVNGGNSATINNY